MASDSRDHGAPRRPATNASAIRPPVHADAATAWNPVDADTERRIAPVGRVSGEAHRQRDGQRDQKDEGAKRAAGLERQQQGHYYRHQPRRENLAQVSLRHDGGDGGDARSERRAAHRVNSHE